jgi:hypothetical protein
MKYYMGFEIGVLLLIGGIAVVIVAIRRFIDRS